MWHESFRRRAFRRVKDGTPTEKRGGAPSGVKRLRQDMNCLTITSAATREFIHPTHDRPLTLREAARLQSFPDKYSFSGNAASMAQQIGNAFPPLMAQLLAEHLKKLDGAHGTGRRNIEAVHAGVLLGYHLTDGAGMSPALLRTDGLLRSLMNEQLVLQLTPGRMSA
jgi:DNA (cytosine-5)-methyltransferase 1